MKGKWMAVSVTTMEALDQCFAQRTKVFCIENPLYTIVKDKLVLKDVPSEYEVQMYEDRQIAVMKRIHGDQIFDDSHYEVCHFLMNESI